VAPVSRRARIAACAVALAAAAGVPTAEAQDRGFSLDRYEPAARGSDWFALDSLDLRGHRRGAAGLTLDWAYKPLVLYDASGNELAALVKHQVFLHAGGSVTLWDRLRVGGSIPVLLFEDGDADATALPEGSSGAFGDLRLDVDARILGAYRSPITLAGGLQVFLPTGSRDSYASDGKLRLVPRLMGAGKLSRVEWAAALSFDIRFLDTTFAGTEVGSEVQLAVAAGARFLDDALIVGPELYFSTGITGGSAFFGRRTTPVELLAGAHYALLRDFRVGLAAGPGLSRGLGTPEVRVLLSFDWAPAPSPRRPSESGPSEQFASIDRSAKQIRIAEQITFEFDSARILTGSERTLSAVARVLADNPGMHVRIEGHTDDRGGPAYNKELSERRAASVLEWLVSHGVERSRLTSVGFGNEKPLDSNETESGRRRNRRVEFRIVDR
jgi:outer membrane protein OmpA-like peptidoglycan-associated protein